MPRAAARLGGALLALRAAAPLSPSHCHVSRNCTGRADSVLYSMGQCWCMCRNGWTGRDCRLCRGMWAQRADCSGCEHPYQQTEKPLVQANLLNLVDPLDRTTLEAARLQDCSTCRRGYVGYPKCRICDYTVNCSGRGLGAEPDISQVQCECRCEPGYVGHQCGSCATGYVWNGQGQCRQCTERGDCSDHADSVQSAGSTECRCECRNEWDGDRCEICPATYKYNASDAGDDCGACSSGYIRYGQGRDGVCTRCDEDEVTGTCNGNHQQVVASVDRQYCECECRRQYEGANCDRCADNYIRYPNCTRCTSVDHFYGHADDALVSSDPTRQWCQVQQCRHQWVKSTNCSTCPDGIDETYDCARCERGWVGYPHCRRCAIGTDCHANSTRLVTDSNRQKCVCVCNNDNIDPDQGCRACKAGFIDFPACKPTQFPTPSPSLSPTRAPSSPSREPTVAPPSMHPSAGPTSASPTTIPSRQPSRPPSAPTGAPFNPSSAPSWAPASSSPTSRPTVRPSPLPSAGPSWPPSVAPSLPPSVGPSPRPSGRPSQQPSQAPSTRPSPRPSWHPSAEPSAFPTTAPHWPPSGSPTLAPLGPTSSPSIAEAPSAAPSMRPSGSPTDRPSSAPTASPTTMPTAPTTSPTAPPSTNAPTSAPSGRPAMPTASPTWAPSARRPAPAPSRPPIDHPIGRPTAPPSVSKVPSAHPTGSLPPSGTVPGSPSEVPTVPTSSAPTGPSAAPLAQLTEPPGLRPTQAPTLQNAAQREGEGALIHSLAGNERAAQATGFMFGITGNSPPLGALALADTRCDAAGTMHELNVVLHPTRLRIGGNMYVGCLVGAIILICGTTVISFMALGMVSILDRNGDGMLDRSEIQQTWLRYVPVINNVSKVDLASFVRHPHIILLVALFLYQGASFSAMRLLVSARDADGNENRVWQRIMGGLFVGVLTVIPFLLFLKVRRGLMPHRRPDLPVDWGAEVRALVRPWDTPKPPRWMQLLLLGEQGDWVSYRRTKHWMNKWQALVRYYEARHAASGAAVEISGMWALSVANAFATADYFACGCARLASAGVHLVLLGYSLGQRPHRCTRDDICRIVTLACLSAAMGYVGVVSYQAAGSANATASPAGGTPELPDMGPALILLQIATVVVLTQVGLRIVSELVLFAGGYRANSQALQWAETDAQLGIGWSTVRHNLNAMFPERNSLAEIPPDSFSSTALLESVGMGPVVQSPPAAGRARVVRPSLIAAGRAAAGALRGARPEAGRPRRRQSASVRDLALDSGEDRDDGTPCSRTQGYPGRRRRNTGQSPRGVTRSSFAGQFSPGGRARQRHSASSSLSQFRLLRDAGRGRSRAARRRSSASGGADALDDYFGSPEPSPPASPAVRRRSSRCSPRSPGGRGVEGWL
eukprot:TRINITY_DN36836_c0_g1_i2.p1 TRINITY_DN36836_c0_g1~~TRINITY_DN36836_c0_g1_i2.p1  ORF type:complete len:1413 (+),score=102.77 TRINITY_DN36836_c0_g1_i2:62-4240(+)